MNTNLITTLPKGAEVARLEAQNAKLIAALERLLCADADICENRGRKSDQAMNRIAAIDQANAVLAEVKGN